MRMLAWQVALQINQTSFSTYPVENEGRLKKVLHDVLFDSKVSDTHQRHKGVQTGRVGKGVESDISTQLVQALGAAVVGTRCCRTLCERVVVGWEGVNLALMQALKLPSGAITPLSVQKPSSFPRTRHTFPSQMFV